MTKTYKLKLIRLAILLVVAGGFLASCKGDDDAGEPETTSTTFSVFSFIGDFGYLNAADTVDSGTISIVESGLELNTFGVGVVQDGEFYYVWNSAESTIDQYQAIGTSYTKVTSIAVPPLLPDERPRVMRISDSGDLVMNSWPDSEGNVYYAVINLPDFTLQTKGSVKPTSIGEFNPSETELVVSGNRAYLATSYFDTSYASIDSLITWVYDYPSFTNGKMEVSTATAGNNGGYVGLCNVVDESGDVYQAPINSGHWGYEDKDAYIMKLSNGEYDDSYNFNLSEALGKTISIWNLMYAENGIAYAKIIENDDEYGWGPLRMTNTVTLARIDLYAKTITEINLPKFKGFFLQYGAVSEGKFYLPISYAEGATNIYSFDISGGADDYSKGASLDGDNILAGSVFKH